MNLFSSKVPVLTGAATVLLIASLQIPASGKGASTHPDFTKGETIPKGATHDWNLGPTGARGWIYSNRMETTEARQVYITQVDPGSPAEGVLRPGDVILGVAGKNFSYDPRTEWGKAISTAEATDGAFSLVRWRDGKSETALIQLPVLGRYSPTAPFDCPKSKLIFERGTEALAKKLKAKPEEGNLIVRSLQALALLSSGREEYLPVVRRQVELFSTYSDPERRSLHSWFYGPVNLLLAEYTLATGDRSFLPDLERITMEIVRGQSVIGSWGHRFVQPGGRLGGYGMMNSPGLPLTVSLILARDAGVQNPELDVAITKSLRMIQFYVGKGSVPYGDHHPWIQTHEDNGKNGIAALMFHLADDAEAARYFSRMSVASHGAERDTGHTGNYFNILWAMPGVALSGPQASGAWLGEFGWYYDLARRWDGTFIHQGPPQAGKDSYAGWDATGACLLAYAQPLGKIHLAGKKKSVAGEIDAATAASLIEDGKGWSPRLNNETYADRDDKALLDGLKSWSPVVRERSALALRRSSGDHMVQLTARLSDPDLFTRLGACQALAELGKRSAPAVPALTQTLKADDLWLRIKAAEALAKIGDAAMETVPELLAMLARPKSESDPRGMEQRYLCFALFDRRDGMLGRSLKGVDREALFRAVQAGLSNEDGRARGTLGTVYSQLSFEEIEPLLPAIHRAVVEPSPSGIMFADGIRMSGLEVLSQHHVAEGVSLCLDIMDIDGWGKKNRINACLKALQNYGGAARDQLPRLEELEKKLQTHPEAKSLEAEIKRVRETIQLIQADTRVPKLRMLREFQ